MHYWGDDWEHWDELHKAITFCTRNWARFKGPSGLGKEKYGTFRHDVWFTGGNKPWQAARRLWEEQVYNIVLQVACYKFPNVVEELLQDSDHPHLIKGLFSGEEIHAKYWKSYEE